MRRRRFRRERTGGTTTRCRDRESDPEIRFRRHRYLRRELMYTRDCFYVATAVSCFLGTAQAAPPSTSPYATDPQSEYVQDSTADSISSLNMVLCVVGSMGAGSMVNAGPYIALVDMNKCDTKKASAAAAGATNYATAVVDVTRATNNDPMLGKVWLSMTEQGSVVDVFIHLSATESP